MTIHRRTSDRYFRLHKDNLHLVLCLGLVFAGGFCCSPGRTGFRRRSAQKLLPLVFKQHVPNVPENSLAASGPSDGRIRRGDERFKLLIPNYNADIVWTDRHGTGSDRMMTQRCKERLDMLAISVQNQWPGVRLRVIAGYVEDGHHAQHSLHYSGRAVDITTSDRDITKYGLLARMAVNCGFDFVYYESRSHIHCSVKKEQPSRSYSGCFHGNSRIITKNGSKIMQDLKEGDEIASGYKEDSSLVFSKVIAFLHKDSSMRTLFARLDIEGGLSLLLTPKHLIFLLNYTLKRKFGTDYLNSRHKPRPKSSEATHAANVIPGDFVYVKSRNGDFSLSQVVNVTLVELSGVYAPLTDDGTIIVDDVLVSCYAVVTNHKLAHAVFFPVRFSNWFNFLLLEFSKYSELFYKLKKYVGTWFADMKVIEHDGEPYIHWYARLLCNIASCFTSFE